MTTVVRTEQEANVASKRDFIGRAWVNVVQKEGENKGKSFIQIRLDRNIKELTVKGTDSFQLWPNVKREGKQDADFRLSVLSAE